MNLTILEKKWKKSREKRKDNIDKIINIEYNT